MAALSLLTLWPYLPAVLVCFFVLRGLHRRYLHPLSKVPGPFLASMTDPWRLTVFLRGRQHNEYLDLHDIRPACAAWTEHRNSQ